MAVGKGLLSCCRNVVYCREFPREVGASEGGGKNAKGGGFALPGAFDWSGGWWLRWGGWGEGLVVSRRECEEGFQQGSMGICWGIPMG